VNTEVDQERIEAFLRDPRLATFVVQVNQVLGLEGSRQLDADSDPFSECDSLELLMIDLYAEGLDAPLLPGMEETIVSLRDIHSHVCRRLGIAQLSE
jgi:hypothetical protein